MTGDVRERLLRLGLRLPDVSPPKGVYLPAVRSGGHVYVSGQVPMEDGELIAIGRVGSEVSPEDARGLSARCALAALAAVETVTGLDTVVRVVKVVGYVSSAEEFTGQAHVVDGAGELLVSVFGEAGRHARVSVGVPRLPLDAPVEIEVTFQIAE